MRRILVTGAAGFIGSHVCEALLKQGDEVTGLDNFDPFYNRSIKERNLSQSRQEPGFHFHEGDLNDPHFLDSLEDADIVVHLAAKPGVLPSIKDPEAYIVNNIGGTAKLLEWMKKRKISKLVFASSSSVYGNNASIPFKESDQVNEPISPYAFTKRSCELLNHTWHSLYGFDIINLRFFTVYGERQRPDLAIHKFVKQVLERKPITIYGDGSTARDYTYYADTVQGVLSSIDLVEKERGLFEIFNLGNHQPVQLLQLVKAIGEATGMEPILQYEEMKPGDVDITYADIEKAAARLNYHPHTSLENGLKNFVAWYKSNS